MKLIDVLGKSDQELTVKVESWGLEFELGSYAWLNDKVWTDKDTAALQRVIGRHPDYLDKLNPELIFTTGDDFEIDSDTSFKIEGVTYKDEYYLVVSETYPYDSKNRTVVKCDAEDWYDAVYELNLHGAEFYCGCDGANYEGMCVCEAEFEDDFESVEEIVQWKQEKERKLEHLRLFGMTDTEFENTFLGVKKLGEDTLLYTDEEVYCPHCLEPQKLDGSFHLYV